MAKTFMAACIFPACGYDARFEDCSICCTGSGIDACPGSMTCGPEGLCRSPGTSEACCTDLDFTKHELPSDGEMVCGSPLRYMIDPGSASITQRCTELGFDRYDSQVAFTAAEWCAYCNARTKQWDGSQWVVNGCNIGVKTLRCCR